MTIKVVKKAVVNAKPSAFCSVLIDDWPAKRV